MKNSHLALAAAFVALVGTLAYVLLRAPDETAELGRFDADPAPTATQDDEPLADVALVASADAMEPPASVVAEEPAAPTRTAVDDALDGRTWADLLFAVDDTTGAPIEDAYVIHVNTKGVREVLPLSSVVRAGDLDERTLAALDTDSHCPRAFFPADLVAVTGSPLHVRMHPSAVIRLEAEGELPDPLPDVTLTVSGFTSWDVEDEDIRELGFADSGELDPLLAFALNLRRIIGEYTDERSRRRQIKWAERTEGVHALLDLGRGPLPFAASNATLVDPLSFPRTLDDLPDGFEVSLYVEGGANVTMIAPDGTVQQQWESAEYTLSAEEPIVVSLRFLGEASVVGSLPPDALEVEIEVLAFDADGNDLDWWSWNEAEFDEDGGFLVEGLRPGHQRLTASWSDGAGLRQRSERRFVLEPDQTHDVGLLAPDAGALISFVPVLVVEGEVDPSRLGGLIDPTGWSIWLSPTSSLDEMDWSQFEEWQLEDEAFMQSLYSEAERADAGRAEYDASLEAFEPARIASVRPGRYDVMMWEATLPEDVANSYRLVGWEHPQQIEVSGDAEHEIRLLLEPATPCEVTLRVPAGGESVVQSVRAMAWNAATDETINVDFESDAEYGSSSDWTAEGRVSLGQGSWTLVAIVDAADMGAWDMDAWDEEMEEMEGVADSDSPMWFVGRAEVAMTDGRAQSVDVPLSPAASVRGGAAGFGYSADEWFGWVELRPVDAPGTLSNLWHGYEEDEARRVTVNGLLPDTEYRVDGTDHTIRTGAAGSLTEL